MADYLKDIVVWDKVNGQPAMSSGVLNRQSELLLIFDRDNAISRRFECAQFKRGTLNDVWQIKRDNRKGPVHGAVFPAQLVETIISNFTAPGQTLYDPFLGTGTTAIKAKIMKRKFIGSELVDTYFYHALANLTDDEGDW